MREIYEDIWNFWCPGASWIIVTTNGAINAKGQCVMGRGIAEQAARRFPSLPLELGRRIASTGNRVYLWPQYGLITLPVKDVWYRPAYLPRIVHSIKQMLEVLKGDRHPVYGVRFGCGNGGLDWEEVRPVVARLLDDRFVIVEGGESVGGHNIETAQTFRSRAERQGILFTPDDEGRVIVGGSRSINYLTDDDMNNIIIESRFAVKELVSGQDGYENSPDMLSLAWADRRGVPSQPFPADWRDLTHPDCLIRYRNGEPYDARAGLRRNKQMGLYVGNAGAYISIWDGSSTGTSHMLTVAKQCGLRIHLKLLKPGRLLRAR